MKLKYYYSDGGIDLQNRQIYLGCELVTNDINEDRDEEIRYQNYFANSIEMLTANVDDCNRILKDIDLIENDDKSITIEGNDMDIFLSKEEIQVNINLDDDWIGQPDGRFQLSQFKEAIIARRKFLLMPKSFDSIVEITL